MHVTASNFLITRNVLKPFIKINMFSRVNVLPDLQMTTLTFEQPHIKTNKVTWADAQADLSLRWAHMSIYVGFDVRRLILS